VRPASAAERARLARGGPSAEWRREVGTDIAGSGEPGYSAYERATLRPALIVQRLAAGYTGPGQKPIVPSHADATLTVRLVPDQDPDEIAALLDAHLRQHAPASLHVEVDRQFAAPPFLLDREPPGLAAAVRAFGAGFGTPPRFVRSGGTIPALPMLRDVLGLRPLLMGFALPGDGVHGPNERLHLPTLWSAIDTSIHLLAALGR
jgi:acetylornithine deacetylase/succinyl-diaminopimelate desuccinylase-like protein